MKNSSIVKSIIKGIVVPILTIAMVLPTSVPVLAAVGGTDIFYTPEELDEFRLILDLC